MSHLHPHFALRLQRRARPLLTARGLRQMVAPWRFYAAAGRLARWLGWLALTAGAVALGAALVLAAGTPGQAGTQLAAHGLQGPAMVLGTGLYVAMAAAAAATLIGVGRLAPVLMVAAAPSSLLWLLMTLLAQTVLVPGGITATGLGAEALWPALAAPAPVLLPFALLVLLAQAVCHDTRRADRWAAVLVLAGLLAAGAVWLSAGPSATEGAAPPGAGLLAALTLVALAAYAGAAVLQRMRLEIVERGRRQLGAEEVQ